MLLRSSLTLFLFVYKTKCFRTQFQINSIFAQVTKVQLAKFVRKFTMQALDFNLIKLQIERHSVDIEACAII